MGICSVAVLLIFLLCDIAVDKIPSSGLVMISNRTVCDVFFNFKPGVFGAKKMLAEPLWCCVLLFDTYDQLTLVE